MTFEEWYDEDEHDLFNFPEEAIKAAWDFQQSTIDALMHEYCPEEMTPSQKIEWANNQALSEQQPE